MSYRYGNIEHADFNSDHNLRQDELPEDPFDLFQDWVELARNREVQEPDAIVLSTIGSDEKPHSRVVYLRDYFEKGLVFFTNYDSKKGMDLLENPEASVLLFYPELTRQVRVEGIVQKTPEEISDAYFSSRPRGSQLGAWASQQSSELESRETLEKRLKEFEEEFKGIEIPRPENWGGYVLQPEYYEFWLGQPNRLHDRIVYYKDNNNWKKKRLNP